jgi:hypothetical protein
MIVMAPALFLMLLAESGDAISVRQSSSKLAAFLVPAGLVMALCFAPPFLRHGAEFVSMPAMHRLTFVHVGWFATIGVFGLPGAGAVAAGAVAAMRNFITDAPLNRSMEASIKPLMLAAWLAVIVGYAVFYLRIRGEPSKLIPIVPFTILILARYLSRPAFIAVCLAVIASGFIGQYLAFGLPGVPSISEYSRQRRAEVHTLHLAWEQLAANGHSAFVITGSYFYPKMMLTRPQSTLPPVTIESWVTAADVEAALQRGATVYCMPKACEWNHGRTGFDPVTEGARILPTG